MISVGRSSGSNSGGGFGRNTERFTVFKLLFMTSMLDGSTAAMKAIDLAVDFAPGKCANDISANFVTRSERRDGAVLRSALISQDLYNNTSDLAR